MAEPSCSQIAGQAVLCGLALNALGVALALMHVIVPPFPRKFFCDDQSIKYPAGACTVPYYILAPVGVISAWITVAAAEWSLAKNVKETSRHLVTLMAFARRVFKTEFKVRYFSQVLHGVYYFSLALAACDFLMGMAKNCFGRHRPFFYTVCQPELPPGGCNSSVAYDVSICRPQLPLREFWDAYRSFPSGHASFSAFCATFIILYLRKRGDGLNALLRRTAQFGVTVGALFAGYSRVFDYKHHWSDVLAGALLGICMAWAAAAAVPSGRTTAGKASRFEANQNGSGGAEETSVEVV